MAYPTIRDDGPTVVLDLHGASVYHAETLVANLVRLAVRRGRSSIKVIHGASTTDIGSGARTIKSRLRVLLESEAYGSSVVDFWTADGFTILSLSASAQHDSTTITIFDIDN